jgi:serine/threonine protein kinase
MGQEGHIRAEKDLLSAASAQALVGPTWIPKLHYSFQDEDHLYFALEFMGGGDLLTMLVSRGSLPEATVRFYAAEMVLALHQTHMLGYIHRDVKPDNFLFTSEGHIRVADFGLATDLHWSHDSAYYEHQRRAVLKRYGVPLDRPAFGNRRRNVEGMQGGWGDKGSSKSVLTWRNRHRRRQAYTICG